MERSGLVVHACNPSVCLGDRDRNKDRNHKAPSALSTHTPENKRQLMNIKIKQTICETIETLPICGYIEAETSLLGMWAAPKGVHPRLAS